MVLLMHVLFVGAVFILDPTLDWRIHEEPWYDFPLLIFLIFALARLKSKSGRHVSFLLGVEKHVCCHHHYMFLAASVSR